MDLYLVYQVYTVDGLAAYWAQCLDDVISAYTADGLHPRYVCTIQATAEQAAQYHGPDFDGRHAYIVIPYSGTDSPFFVAADSRHDAFVFVEECIGSNRFWMDRLSDSDASAFLEPGWDL